MDRADDAGMSVVWRCSDIQLKTRRRERRCSAQDATKSQSTRRRGSAAQQAGAVEAAAATVAGHSAATGCNLRPCNPSSAEIGSSVGPCTMRGGSLPANCASGCGSLNLRMKVSRRLCRQHSRRRQREAEARAAMHRFIVRPDAPAMRLDDGARNG